MLPPLNDVSAYSKSFWFNLPFFTRSLGLMMILIYILSLFFPNIEDYIVNEPESTIQKYQLWRIGISFLIHESILPLSISLIFFILIFAGVEKKQGSVYFILSIFMDIILIQSCFCIGSFLIWKLTTVKFYSTGLYSLILMRIAYVPPILPVEKFQFLKQIEKIPHKYFSAGVFIIFAFTNKFNVLDLFCGILMGFLIIQIEKSFKNKNLFNKIINEQLLVEIEEKIFKYVKDQEQFIKVENAVKELEQGDYQVFDNDTVSEEIQNISSQSSEYQQVPKEKEIKELNTENEESITNTNI